MAANVEHFNVTLPDRFTLKFFNYGHSLKVVCLASVKLQKGRLYLCDVVTHNAASTRSPHDHQLRSMPAAIAGVIFKVA